jgi:hypothetical protein
VSLKQAIESDFADAITVKTDELARTAMKLGEAMYRHSLASDYSGGNNVPNVYVEPRPKGRPEGSPVTDFVVEDHADHVLATFRTQQEALSGRRNRAMLRLSLESIFVE